MKPVKALVGLIALFVTLPVQFYANWLMLQHVGATPLMWAIFWFQTPMIILINAFSNVIFKAIDKED